MAIFRYKTTTIYIVCLRMPGNGVLAYCDVAGQLGTLVNCYGKKSSSSENEIEDIETVERDNGTIIYFVINKMLLYQSMLWNFSYIS